MLTALLVAGLVMLGPTAARAELVARLKELEAEL